MKALLFFLFCFMSFNTYGQQLIIHADTACIDDPKIVLIRDAIETERSFALSLASSIKTLERLKREYSHVFKMPSKFKKYSSPEQFYDEIILTKELEAMAEYEYQERICRIVEGRYNLVYEEYSLGSVLDFHYDTTFLALGLYSSINKVEVIIPSGRDSCEFVDNFQDKISAFKPDPGDIMFRSLFYSKFRMNSFSTPMHEFSHQSTDAIFFLHRETIKILRQVTQFDGWNAIFFGVTTLKDGSSFFSYLDNPSEIKARLDVLRYLLYQEKICDLRVEDFKMKHLRLLRKNSYIQSDSNVSELLNQILIKERDLIWLMNNFA